MKSAKELGEYLDTLTAKAPALRAAGVLRFNGGPLGEVVLNPNAGNLLPEAPSKPKPEEAKDYDPMNDPVSYGLAPGEPLPWKGPDA